MEQEEAQQQRMQAGAGMFNLEPDVWDERSGGSEDEGAASSGKEDMFL